MNWLQEARSRNPYPIPPAIPPRYLQHKLADLPNTVVRKTAEDYLTRFWTVAPTGQGPLFLGRAETWKTTAAALVAQAVAAAGVETTWVSVPRYQVDFERSRFDSDLTRTIKSWESVSFLVMDDFAVIGRNSYGHMLLNAIITARFDAQKPTCWTGNLDLPEGREWDAISELYGPLFARRLEATSTGYVAVII